MNLSCFIRGSKTNNGFNCSKGRKHHTASGTRCESRYNKNTLPCMCTLWCVLPLCARENGNHKYDFDLGCISLISSTFVISRVMRSASFSPLSRRWRLQTQILSHHLGVCRGAWGEQTKAVGPQRQGERYGGEDAELPDQSQICKPGERCAEKHNGPEPNEGGGHGKGAGEAEGTDQVPGSENLFYQTLVVLICLLRKQTCDCLCSELTKRSWRCWLESAISWKQF